MEISTFSDPASLPVGQGCDASCSGMAALMGEHGRLGTAGSLAWCPAVVPRGITQCRERAMDGSQCGRLAVWSPAGHTTTLDLSFMTCKIKMTIAFSWDR